MPGSLHYPGNGPIATTRFQNRAPEWLNLQERGNGTRRSRVKVILLSVGRTESDASMTRS